MEETRGIEQLRRDLSDAQSEMRRLTREMQEAADRSENRRCTLALLIGCPSDKAWDELLEVAAGLHDLSLTPNAMTQGEAEDRFNAWVKMQQSWSRAAELRSENYAGDRDEAEVLALYHEERADRLRRYALTGIKEG